MTDPRGSQGWDEVHALSGAYAVDALDHDERARFEAHLQQCGECRTEVDGLRETAALLGADDAVPPSASVRVAVLSGISAVRPLPPLPPQGPARPDDAPEETGLPPAATAPVADLAARRERRLGLRRVPLLVAAAAVLIAAVGGAIWLRPDDEPATPRYTVAERVLQSDDAKRFEKRFPDGAEATVVVSPSVGRAVILTEDMPPAPEGKDYQLWLQTPAGEMRDAGVMPDVRDTTKLLAGDASRAIGVGITVEPDGGSEQPSSEPIAYFSLVA